MSLGESLYLDISKFLYYAF